MAYYNTGGFGQPLSSDWANTPGIMGIGSDYYDNAANGGYGFEQFLGQSGTGGLGDKFGNWLRRNEGNIYGQYGAAQGQDPSLKWTNYLQGQQGNLQSQFAGMNPIDKGESAQRQLKWL